MSLRGRIKPSFLAFLLPAVLGYVLAHATLPAGLNSGGHLVPDATDGSHLISLNASSLASGTVSSARIDQTAAYNWSGVHTFSNYRADTAISAPATPAAGTIRNYATTFHGVEFPSYKNNLGVEISPSRDLVIEVKNSTGSSIAANSVVYVNSASGNVPTIALSQADYTMAKLPALGLTLAAIADGAFGLVITRGTITGINTNAFTAGDTIYVSASTPGAFTNVAPSRPSVEQAIGTVTVKGVGNGEISLSLVPLNLHRIDGTNQTSFGVGDGHTAGPMSFQVLQTAGTGVLQWTVTGNRTLTLPDATDTLVGLSTSDVLTNKTLNCANNTCTVRLGSDVSGVTPVANGGTNSSTALGNNKAMVSSGGKIVETASTCPAGTVLQGGSPPDCTAAATISTSVATPRVDATAGSGTLILNANTGNTVQLSVNSVTAFAVGASGITASQPLAMSSQKITGAATATTTGDALVWPWITATNGSASLSSSPYNIASGSYASIGLALSLPSAGTYLLAADLRTLINASLGTGGFIECQLYNTTDSAAIANSERIGAYEPVISQQYYGQISINEIITVAAAKTIDVQCLRSGATTYTTSAVYSDTNGRSRFSYVKVSP